MIHEIKLKFLIKSVGVLYLFSGFGSLCLDLLPMMPGTDVGNLIECASG